MWSIVLLHNRETYVCDFGSKYDSQNEKGSWIYLPANFTGTSSSAYRPMEKNSYQNNKYVRNIWSNLDQAIQIK